MGGRFGQPSGICWGLDGDGPRFRPPEGSFVNFFAKMANTVLRSRCANFVPCHIGRATRPSTRIALPTRQEGLMRLMMVWAHDWRCIPTSLANKIPVASICRGCSRCAKTCATAVTTSALRSKYLLRLISLATFGCDGRCCSSRRSFYTHAGSNQAQTTRLTCCLDEPAEPAPSVTAV